MALRTCYWCNGVGLIFNYDWGEWGEWFTCEVCQGEQTIDDPDADDDDADAAYEADAVQCFREGDDDAN